MCLATIVDLFRPFFLFGYFKALGVGGWSRELASFHYLNAYLARCHLALNLTRFNPEICGDVILNAT